MSETAKFCPNCGREFIRTKVARDGPWLARKSGVYFIHKEKIIGPDLVRIEDQCYVER